METLLCSMEGQMGGDQLRFALRKLDGPSQRRIMRSYGAYFRPLPGETPEEGTGGEEV